MPFPDVSRVRYRRSPLDQVICQLRFPPILRIDASAPAVFQEAIRSKFPEFAESSDVRMELPAGLTDKISPALLSQAVKSATTRNYQFGTTDGAWKVNLTRAFLALTSSAYETWEDFSARFEAVAHPFVEEYKPAYFTRIGLRYTDVIRRSKLGLKDRDWADLLRPAVAGLAGDRDISGDVRAFEGSTEIVLEDGVSVLRIRTGYVTPKDSDEVCFSIDSDFFNDTQTPIGEMAGRLEFLHSRATRLIQWCVTKMLHNAMEPEPV